MLTLMLTLVANSALSATLTAPANNAVVAAGVNTFSWSLESGDTTNNGLRLVIYSDVAATSIALDACWSGSPANGGSTSNSAMETCDIDLSSLSDGAYYWRVEKSFGGSWVNITTTPDAPYTLNVGTPPATVAPATPVPVLPLWGLLSLAGLVGLFGFRKFR
jgi:hypothetical protein